MNKPKIKFSKSNIPVELMPKVPCTTIISRPTKEDIKKAETELQIIISVHYQAENVIDYKTSQIWLTGFLHGLDIKRTPFLSVHIVPLDWDLDKSAKALQDKIENTDVFTDIGFKTTQNFEVNIEE